MRTSTKNENTHLSGETGESAQGVRDPRLTVKIIHENL